MKQLCFIVLVCFATSLSATSSYHNDRNHGSYSYAYSGNHKNYSYSHYDKHGYYSSHKTKDHYKNGKHHHRPDHDVQPATCDVYPFTLSSTLIKHYQAGQSFKIRNSRKSTQHFGWLSWNFDHSVNALNKSLTPPGNSDLYINPVNWKNETLADDKWVKGIYGAGYSRSLHWSLKKLKNKQLQKENQLKDALLKIDSWLFLYPINASVAAIIPITK